MITVGSMPPSQSSKGEVMSVGDKSRVRVRASLTVLWTVF